MCNDGIATDFEFEREVAYSREPNQPKQYVQNLLTRDAAKIYEMWVRYKKLSEYFLLEKSRPYLSLLAIIMQVKSLN